MKYFAALFLLLSISCSNNKNITNISSSNIDEKITISLIRTACFGTCPIYELSIQANGMVNYTGKGFVDNLGEFKGQIKTAKTKALFQKINTYDWEAYPEKFPIDNVDFPQWKLIYDSPMLKKEVRCNSNASEELKALALELDALVKDIDLTQIEK